VSESRYGGFSGGENIVWREILAKHPQSRFRSGIPSHIVPPVQSQSIQIITIESRNTGSGRVRIDIRPQFNPPPQTVHCFPQLQTVKSSQGMYHVILSNLIRSDDYQSISAGNICICRVPVYDTETSRGYMKIDKISEKYYTSNLCARLYQGGLESGCAKEERKAHTNRIRKFYVLV
jgi:hypothetical protein